MPPVAFCQCHISVHPHGRGDNTQLQFKAHEFAGSPPRAWGQCVKQKKVPGIDRFTPTGVGTIRNRVHIAARRSVHPHGRGDNYQYVYYPQQKNGSPPRAWGQYVLKRGDDAIARFTPTGVGTILASQAF